MSNMDPTKKTGVNYVLVKGKQFLSFIRHASFVVNLPLLSISR